MCSTLLGANNATSPAAPPPPPKQDPLAPVFGGQGDSAVAAARKGRSALRIDLASGGLGGGTGLNIPT